MYKKVLLLLLSFGGVGEYCFTASAAANLGVSAGAAAGSSDDGDSTALVSRQRDVERVVGNQRKVIATVYRAFKKAFDELKAADKNAQSPQIERLLEQQFSTDREVKKAYNVLALFTHPDKSKGKASSECFKKVADAYALYEDKYSDEDVNKQIPLNVFSNFDWFHPNAAAKLLQIYSQLARHEDYEAQRLQQQDRSTSVSTWAAASRSERVKMQSALNSYTELGDSDVVWAPKKVKDAMESSLLQAAALEKAAQETVKREVYAKNAAEKRLHDAIDRLREAGGDEAEAAGAVEERDHALAEIQRAEEAIQIALGEEADAKLRKEESYLPGTDNPVTKARIKAEQEYTHDKQTKGEEFERLNGVFGDLSKKQGAELRAAEAESKRSLKAHERALRQVRQNIKKTEVQRQIKEKRKAEQDAPSWNFSQLRKKVTEQDVAHTQALLNERRRDLERLEEQTEDKKKEVFAAPYTDIENAKAFYKAKKEYAPYRKDEKEERAFNNRFKKSKPATFFNRLDAHGVNPSILGDLVDLHTFTSSNAATVGAGAALSAVGRTADSFYGSGAISNSLTRKEEQVLNRGVFGENAYNGGPGAHTEVETIHNPDGTVTKINEADRYAAAESAYAGRQVASGISLFERQLAQPITGIVEHGYAALNGKALIAYNKWLANNKDNPDVQKYMKRLRNRKRVIMALMAFETALKSGAHWAHAGRNTHPGYQNPTAEEADRVKRANMMAMAGALLGLTRRAGGAYIKYKHISRAEDHADSFYTNQSGDDALAEDDDAAATDQK